MDKIGDALNEHSKPVKGSHVHLLGVAYKRDIDDLRESPALDVAHLLQQRGAHVTYSDPYISRVEHEGVHVERMGEEEALAAADCVVIITDHRNVDYAKVGANAKLIVDTRNAMKHIGGNNVVRL